MASVDYVYWHYSQDMANGVAARFTIPKCTPLGDDFNGIMGFFYTANYGFSMGSHYPIYGGFK
ncbi:hypothetical protein V6O07_19495 [Arthrospira platensis SPKY2]